MSEGAPVCDFWPAMEQGQHIDPPFAYWVCVSVLNPEDTINQVVSLEARYGVPASQAIAVSRALKPGCDFWRAYRSDKIVGVIGDEPEAEAAAQKRTRASSSFEGQPLPVRRRPNSSGLGSGTSSSAIMVHDDIVDNGNIFNGQESSDGGSSTMATFSPAKCDVR